MKPRLGLLTMLLLFCFAALRAQTHRTVVITKNNNTENVVTLLGNHDQWAKNQYVYSYSGNGDPCKVFIGVGTTSEPGGGVKVDYTIDDTPARTYGVQVGDVILALDGKAVNTQSELIRERDKHQQGDAFTLNILRNGAKMNINARFKECSKEDQKLAQEQELLKTRPILGIYENEDVNAEGIVIGEAIPGKGADAAGLQSGDVITTVNGRTVTGVGTLRTTLNGHKPGDQVTVVYLRDGHTQETKVILSGDRAIITHNIPRDPCVVFIGVYTSETGPDGKGVRVTGIIDDTPAKKSAVQPGDIILALDGQPVNTHLELRRERDKHQPGEHFQLTVSRDGSVMEIDATFKVCPKPGEVQPTKEVVELAQPTPVQQPENQLSPDRTLKLNLDAYPNPTVGPLTIQFEAEAVPTTVRIMDASGKVVYTNELTQFNGYFNEQINLFGETPGTYTLSVQQGKRMASKNIVLMPRA